ncbi:family 1 glycosylhydrolase, partial [Shigella sonnei]|nr:family 1 glycosylhydrolase [Shigella sonnei]
ICLYHFDMPLNLAEKYNGFLSRKVKEAFVRFGQEMMKRFADKVKYWIVFNEHNLYFADGFEQAWCDEKQYTYQRVSALFSKLPNNA